MALVPKEDQTVPCAGLVKDLIAVCAYLKELETQSHLIHLNYEGINFISVHEYLKTQYESHVQQFDTLSEHIRSLDYWMPMCSNGLREALTCFKHVESRNGRDMLTTYYQNLEDLVTMIETIQPMAVDMRCFDIANFLDELMGASNKGSWFIKSTLRGC